MWRTVKLGEIASWVRGLTYSKKDEVVDGGIGVLRATNIDLATHKIVLDDIRHVSDAVKVKDDKYAQVGDLLVCTASGSKSHVGKVAIIEEDLEMAFGGFMAAIRCNEDCHPRYLYHVLTSQKFKWHLNNLGNGANINNLKFSQIEEYELPLPLLAEQQRIVAKLDAAFAEIDRAIELEHQKCSAATALESQAMTGWLAQHSSQSAVYKVSDAVDKGWIQAPFDGNHGEIHPKAKDYVAFGVPFLMASDIRNGHADLTNCKFLSRELADSLRKGFAKNKDVLLTHKGTIGEAAILSCNLDYVMLTPQVTAYRVLNENSLSRDFLYYQFKSEYFQRQIKGIAGIGTTRAYIGITRQKELELYIPSIQLQNEAVNLMRTIEPHTKQLARVATEKIVQLTNLKSAILAQELQSPQSEAA